MDKLHLLPGVPENRVRAILDKAGGNEIASGKFASPQSSAALAVNGFGWFLDRPADLPSFPGLEHCDWPAIRVDVERQMRFPWRGGRHPWLDAAVETQNCLIGVESMLADDLAGIPYNKAAHNRQLQAQTGRSKGSVEFKHQNISAVMLGLGQPWIPGYKPAANFQAALVDGVLRWLDRQEDWLAPRPSVNAVRETGAGGWIGPPVEALLEIGPVPSHRNEPPPVDPEFMAKIGRKYDVATRDARNRALGKAGEERVLAHERARLQQADRADLARKIRWTSVEDGDGYGYDIASFEADGSDRLLEVKTTNGWERTPFHLTRNEIAVAEDRRDHWHLVRVWDFARTPRAFELRPPLEAHIDLTPTSFLAALR